MAIKTVIKAAKRKAKKATEEKDYKRAQRYKKKLIETFTGGDDPKKGLCVIFEYTKKNKQGGTRVLEKEDFEDMTINELCQKLNESLIELEKMI